MGCQRLNNMKNQIELTHQNQWQYFLSIEQSLINTLNYVHYHDDNKNAYSNEFAKIILLSCSEIDVILKQLCKKYNKKSRAKNIFHYGTYLSKTFQGIGSTKVECPIISEEFQPFSNWSNDKIIKPDWWESYNKIKHERNTNFPKANQKNAFESCAGLFLLLLYLNAENGYPEPSPVLFDFNFPKQIVIGSNLDLPGVRDALSRLGASEPSA